jgi:outer membrane protein insertion porin family
VERSGDRRKQSVTGLLFALLILGGNFCFAPELSAAEKEAVAVLPFEVHASKPLDHLRVGLQEMLTGRLADRGLKMRGTQEINQHSLAFEPGLKRADLVRLGRDLDVGWVVSGSLTQIGEKASLDLQVINITAKKPPFYLFMVSPELDALEETIVKVAKSVYNEVSGVTQVDSVDVQGNLRVEKAAILAVIDTAKGDMLDHERLDQDLRNIYKMGFFTDVKIETKEGPRGRVVVFHVTEKPSIGRISFEGNEKEDADDLRKEVGLKRYSILDRNAVRQGTNRLREYYRKKGYYRVEIEEKIETLPNNEVHVQYLIEENEKIYISKIEFLGNRRFDDDTLRDLMETSEKGLLSWITKSGYLDRKKLDFDLQKISAYYHNHGFIHAKVGEPLIKYEKEAGLRITIDIQEGHEYTVGEVMIEGELIRPVEELLKEVRINKREVFNRETVRNDIQTLRDLYADEGYAYSEISPRMLEDDENFSVDITYEISKEEKVRFERINIDGNTATRDKVIRRELKVVEGEYFSAKDLRRSAENLHRLGFFEDVQINTRKGSAEDLMLLDVRVKERPTGSFSLGAGYSSVDKSFGVLEIAQNNFLGLGQKLVGSAKLGEISSEFDIKFVEPWLLDKPLSLGIDLYRIEEDDEDEEYTKESFGSAVNFGFPLGIDDFTEGSVKYGYDDSDIRNVSETASLEIRDMEGRNVTSSVTLGITRDSRDKPWNTTKGSVNRLTFEYAGGGLGGDVYFNKYFARSAWYFPLFWDTVLLLQGRWGFIEERDGGKLPVFHKFRLGGINTVRGFDYRSISPLDPDTGDRIGGEKMMAYNLEYRFPLLKEQGVVGLVFFDAGNVFTDEENYTFSDIRRSVGTGIRWYSPVGPLRLEYGHVLNRRTGEPSGNWEFTVGGVF